MGFYSKKENILDIANGSMFAHAAKGEDHIYSDMSLEERQQWKDRYVEKNKQPYHETVRFVENLCKASIGGLSVFSKEGFEAMLKDPNLENQYINGIATRLFKSDLSWKKTYANTLYNSLENYKLDQSGIRNFGNMSNIFATEGVGAMATYQNRDNFAGMAAFGIAGWFGRSKILDLYLPIEENTAPELKYKFILEFAIHPKTKERIPLPAGYRDESLYGMFDLPKVLPLYVDEASTPHIFADNTQVELIDYSKSKGANIVYKNSELGHGYIKSGNQSNLLEDSASDDNDISSKDALEPTVAIEDLLYIHSYDTNRNNAPIYRVLKRDIGGEAAEGVQNVFRFRGIITFENIKVLDGGDLKDVAIHKEKVFGEIDLDSSDFVATSSSMEADIAPIIKGFKVHALISDTANQRAGLEHQVERHSYTLRIEYTSFGHIPLTPYVLDNWNLGNDTLGYVASMTDAMTRAYAITRDLKLEQHLKRDFEKPLAGFVLHQKLGGFYKEIEHNFALTGPVLDANPYVQTRYALRERVIAGLAAAETYMYIPQDVSRQWVFFGPDAKVRAFANVENYNRAPDAQDQAPVNAGGQRFGFNLDEAGSIVDSLGRNVKIIGITDIRWMDRNIIGGLKSTNIEYPTFLYYAYLFRIFTGIDPEYRNLSAVLFMGRDAAYSMVQAHAQIIVTNMGDDLYEKVVSEARTRTVIEKTN